MKMEIIWNVNGNIMERKWKYYDYFQFAIPNYVDTRYIVTRHTYFYASTYKKYSYYTLYSNGLYSKSVKCIITYFSGCRLPERTKVRELVPANQAGYVYV